MGGVKVGGKTYKLAIKYYDDVSTPARGAQLVERLINHDGIKFMLGPYSSGMTKAVLPITEKYRSEESRGGNESVNPWRFSWLPYNKKNKLSNIEENTIIYTK